MVVSSNILFSSHLFIFLICSETKFDATNLQILPPSKFYVDYFRTPIFYLGCGQCSWVIFVVIGQPAEIAIKDSSKNVLPIAPNKREMLSDSNLKITSEKVEEHNSTPTADEKILGSSSIPEKKKNR